MDLLENVLPAQRLQRESTTPKVDDDDSLSDTATRENLLINHGQRRSRGSDLNVANGDAANEDLVAGGAEEKEWRCSPRSCDWKKLLLITSLWWSYFLINGAHSMIGPFFPNEV